MFALDRGRRVLLPRLDGGIDRLAWLCVRRNAVLPSGSPLLDVSLPRSIAFHLLRKDPSTLGSWNGTMSRLVPTLPSILLPSRLPFWTCLGCTSPVSPPVASPFEKGPFPLSPSLAVGRDVWFGWLETRKDRSPDAPETRRAHVKGRGPGRSMSSLARLFTGKKEREGKEGKGKCV